MVTGLALFEFTSRLITHLEAKGDYGSPLYLILLTLTTLGLMIAVNYALSLYIEAKRTVKPNLSPSQNKEYSVVKKMRDFIKKFLHNKKAVGASAVVGIAVALLLSAYLLPIAINAIYSANTTGWDDAVTTIFQVVLVILAIVSIALKFLPRR